MSCKSPAKEAKTLMILLLRRRRLQRLHPVSCISDVLSFRDMPQHKLTESQRNLPIASIRLVFKRLISTQEGSCRTGGRVIHSQTKGQRCSVENSKSASEKKIDSKLWKSVALFAEACLAIHVQATFRTDSP